MTESNFTRDSVRALVERLAPADLQPELRGLMQAPELAAMLDRGDARALDQRRQMRAALDALPATHEPLLRAARERSDAAEEAVRDAEEALAVARAANAAAQAGFMAAEIAAQRQASILEAGLRRTADARIAALMSTIDNLLDAVRAGAFGHATVLRTTQTLMEAHRTADATKMQASTRDETTATLSDLAGIVTNAVRGLDLGRGALPIIAADGSYSTQPIVPGNAAGKTPPKGPRAEAPPMRGNMARVRAAIDGALGINRDER